MSESSLKQRYMMLKLLSMYITYAYLAFIIYVSIHRVFDDDAAIVALLLSIPFILFRIFIERHVE